MHDRPAVAVSPDGSLIALATNDGRLSLLSAATGKAVRSWSTGGSDANDLAFSSSSTRLAAGGDDGLVRIFDVAKGSVLASYASNTAGVRRVAWGAQQRTIASAGLDARVRIHDLGSGKLVGELAGPAWGGTGLAYSPDRLTLYSSAPGGVFRWGLGSGLPRWILTGHGGVVTTSRFSPDGRLLATQSTDQIRLWRVENTDDAYATIQAATLDAAFTPDGRELIIAGVDGIDGVQPRLLRYDALTGQRLGTLGTVTGRFLTAVAVAPSGAVATVDADGLVSALGADGELRWSSRWAGAGFALRFSPDGATLAIGGPQAGQVILVDARTGKYRARWQPGGDVNAGSLTFSPDGRDLVIGRSDGQVDIVDPATGAVTRSFVAHQNKVYAVAYSPDGLLLATGGFNGGGVSSDGFDGGLRLWDVATGQLIGNRAYHDSQVEALDFSADGRWLASGGADREVLLWPAMTQWRERACDTAERDLTLAERERFLTPADRDTRVC